MFNEESSNKESLNIMAKTSFSYIKPTLHMALICILLGTSATVQAQKSKLVLSVEDVNVLIPAIEAAERNLFLNMKIDSETWVETKANLSDPCESWQRTPIYVSCTAWFEGHPNGKARVDVHKQVTKWIDGAAPYIEESYSVGFDGKHGRVVRYSTTHSGRTHHTKEGEHLSDTPGQLGGGFLGSCTGGRFSLYFFFNNNLGVSSFSQFLRKATSPDVVKLNAFEFTLEEFQGVECIKADSSFDRHIARITYWLDPARGFALLGHDNIRIREDGSERVSKRIRVTKLKEVTPGIWWPMEATLISSPLSSGDPYSRTVYHASNVVANDPNFNENIFTVPFPDGYLINDQVSGKKYRAGEEPNAPKNQPKK